MDATLRDDVWAGANHMRVLVCHTCKDIEEVPDFQGHPDDDVYLEYVVKRHPEHKGQLFRLPIALWLMPEAKDVLIKQMTGGSPGLEVMWDGYYATYNTFKEDAMTCYRKHSSPKGGCPEFRSDKKQLKPDTKAERKEAGLSTRDVPTVFLCDWCPVRSYYANKHNEEKGIA